ncbi:MAG: hypothetical protein HY774_25185 [Acidobacteria bacterium]|nr:hypothetical protein [Acidobacteriota bacterium]
MMFFNSNHGSSLNYLVLNGKSFFIGYKEVAFDVTGGVWLEIGIKNKTEFNTHQNICLPVAPENRDRTAGSGGQSEALLRSHDTAGVGSFAEATR